MGPTDLAAQLLPPAKRPPGELSALDHFNLILHYLSTGTTATTYNTPQDSCALVERGRSQMDAEVRPDVEVDLVGQNAVHEEAGVHDNRPGILRQDARDRLLQVKVRAQLPVPARHAWVLALVALLWQAMLPNLFGFTTNKRVSHFCKPSNMLNCPKQAHKGHNPCVCWHGISESVGMGSQHPLAWDPSIR